MKNTSQETSAPTVIPHFISSSFQNCQKPPCKRLSNSIRESPNKPRSYRQIQLCLFNSPCSIYRFWTPANKDTKFLVSSFECFGFTLDLAGGFHLCKDSPGILPLGMIEETYSFCSHPISCQETQVMWFYEFMLILQQPERWVSLQHCGLKSELHPMTLSATQHQWSSLEEKGQLMNGIQQNPVPPKLPTIQCTESIKLQQSTSAFDLL